VAAAARTPWAALPRRCFHAAAAGPFPEPVPPAGEGGAPRIPAPRPGARPVPGTARTASGGGSAVPDAPGGAGASAPPQGIAPAGPPTGSGGRPAGPGSG